MAAMHELHNFLWAQKSRKVTSKRGEKSRSFIFITDASNHLFILMYYTFLHL